MNLNKTTKIILIAAIAIIVLLSVTFCSIIVKLTGDVDDPIDIIETPSKVLPPDYPPMETDPNQEKVEGDESVAPNSSGGSLDITYNDTAYVDLSDKVITFSYANTRSNQDAVVRLSVQDVLLGESATINPGNKITTLTLNDDAAARLQPGKYLGSIILGLYNPETGEKSMIDLDLKVDVIVEE